MAEEQPLQVARCTKIIADESDADKSKYVINVKQIAKFVVNLGERVSPTDIEEGMRVGYAASVEPLNSCFSKGVLMLTDCCYKCRSKQIPDSLTSSAQDRSQRDDDDC
jgi:hypothetical protein